MQKINLVRVGLETIEKSVNMNMEICHSLLKTKSLVICIEDADQQRIREFSRPVLLILLIRWNQHNGHCHVGIGRLM
ncbi:2265_t:CDS:2 [Gigaspora rosea]|nr:2265_t:CDS:2 [Gigaspora rosea]